MDEIIKPNRNNIRDLHLHKHTTYINVIPKVKPIENKKYRIVCLVCGTQKRVNTITKFCSQTCYNNYSQYKHQEFINKQNNLYNQTRVKSWWPF